MQMLDDAVEAVGVELPGSPEALINRVFQSLQCRLGNVYRCDWGLAIHRAFGFAALLVLVAIHSFDVGERLAPTLVKLLAGVIRLPLLAQGTVAANLHQSWVLVEQSAPITALAGLLRVCLGH